MIMSEETFADLLTPNLPAIRRFVLARMRVADNADDVIQQTLLQAFAHRHQLRVPAKFKSWISSIAMNEIRGFVRRTKVGVPLDTLPVLASSDRWTCPHRVYEQRERAERLRAALAALSDRDRNAIRLMDFAGMKLNEAANALSVSPAAFKSTHFRARQRLGRAIRDARKGLHRG
jgi:RNA polymerase sigma-70 factor (ECF subfamily)